MDEFELAAERDDITDQRRTALIVGGSGMLSHVVAWCSRRYERVIATCRTDGSAQALRRLGPNVEAVATDWSNRNAWSKSVLGAVGDGPIDLSVVWAHSTAGILHREIQPRTCGLFVRVRGHATAMPGTGELAPWIDSRTADAEHLGDRERHVILGWHREPRGRWLSSDEIGIGVVRQLEAWTTEVDADPVAWVGSVRPWESRPPGWS